MKKIIAGIMALCLCGGIAAPVNFAGADVPSISASAADEKATWVIDTIHAKPGEKAVVSVYVSGDSTLKVAGASFDIAPKGVDFYAVSHKCKAYEDAPVTVNPKTGEYAFATAAGSGSAAKDNAKILTITYKVPVNASGEIELKWEDVVVSDTNGNIVTSKVTLKNGKIIIDDDAVAGNFNGIDYKKYSDHVEIIGVDETVSGELKIPSTIEGLPVTAISENTIDDSRFEGVTSIIVPDTVKTIGADAFAYCTDLETITINDPDCKINDKGSGKTISNGVVGSTGYFNGTIIGYDDSTAQKYAEKNGYKFETLGKAPEKPIEKPTNKPSDTVKFLLGDANLDEVVDASDASKVLAEYAALSTGKESTFNEIQKLASDTNKDGTIDASDASQILMFYAYSSTGGTEKLMENWLK